ncbi:hypothetical protein JTE90_029365 [Oedothorax gibbosus]|uniref:Uncharacterized protein n=1 Tax=Oedothorax gibbosus TaxID=931172 RepID=A0AAV6VMP4_9ARAC|nr:hypothetical protein JTE90_029365 [Oedothorax gibbosus]
MRKNRLALLISMSLNFNSTTKLNVKTIRIAFKGNLDFAAVELQLFFQAFNRAPLNGVHPSVMKLKLSVSEINFPETSETGAFVHRSMLSKDQLRTGFRSIVGAAKRVVNKWK